MLKSIVFVLRSLGTVTFVAAGVVLLVALLPLFGGSGSYPWVSAVIAFDASNLDLVRSLVPTEIGRFDLARVLLAGGLLLVGATLETGANQLSALSSARSARRSPSRWRKRPKKVRKQPRSAPQRSSVGSARSGEKKSREELVQLMVEAKRELDAMTRHVAFLALDVVESTNMKLGEDPAFIEHDFNEFKKMVDGVVAREGALKSAWTPDGAMICFDSLEGAVRAAQEMLRKLQRFNAETRMMQTPFRVRCGVNAGRVQYEAARPMEEMSDNVIDVAGHMQKYAEPDTIFVAGDLLRRRKVKRGFTPADTEVDGYAVSVWRGPSADPVATPTAARSAELDSME